MSKDDKVIGKLGEAGELGTAGKDILFKGLPGTRVHHQEACSRNFQHQRVGGGSEDIEQCRRKLSLTFAEIGSIATTKQDHLMIALNALSVDML
jgi:hypothetical protein